VAANDRALLLIAAGAVLLLTAASTRGQNDVGIDFHTFQDTRGVTVLSPDMSYERDYTDRTAVRIKFGLDAITAASDSCARCHPDGANNTRAVGGASVVRKYGDTKLTFGGEFSKEQFYAASTAQFAISRSLNQANTTVAGGFSYSFNQPQLHPSDTVESQHSADTFGSVTQSWTKSTITQFGYELNQINGYQTNPFLRTSVNGVLTIGNSPDRRTRQVLTARLRQALGQRTSIDVDYRHYIDSWDVNSNALSVGLSHHFGDRLVLGGDYRRYGQTAAYFYQPSYTGTPEYYTGDFRLFPFDSNNYSGHLAITPHDGFFNLPAGSSLQFQYERYYSTTDFVAGVFSGGIRIPLK